MIRCDPSGKEGVPLKIIQFRVFLSFILIKCTLFFTPSLFSISDGVIDVRLPAYDSSGRLLWEMTAAELELLEDKSYFALNPTLSILENRKPTTQAFSKDGIFDLNKNTAGGNDVLYIKGNGFGALGNPWTFEGQDSEQSSRLHFAENGNVGFDYDLGREFAGLALPDTKDQSTHNHSLIKEIKNAFPDVNAFPTTAKAESMLLLDLGGGKHEFVLRGQTEIKMKPADNNGTLSQTTVITCEEAVVELENDPNRSDKKNMGEIKKITATGKVIISQPFRICKADRIEWNEEGGGGLLLEGSAEVHDSKWGKAEGEKILLRKEDGRAEVMGGESRSKLSIPISPNFNLTR